MKIAIIGSGISGLTVAYYLSKFFDVHVFESESRIGGHTHTVDVNQHAIDTGFIVFNNRNYPNFMKLLHQLNVKYRETTMSFAVSNAEMNLEYCGSNINTLFADRRNIVRPKFYKLIQEILKFNKLVKKQKYNLEDSIATFIQNYKFSNIFTYGYLIPMISSIWSIGLTQALNIPINFIATFFMNHGLLDLINRPIWYTIIGGSREYISPITRNYKDKIFLNAKVQKVMRIDNTIQIKVANHDIMQYDKVIFACHSDQALQLIDSPTVLEHKILNDIKYVNNDVLLHKDTSLLPNLKKAYASWNYKKTLDSSQKATLTYNMNILQGLISHETFCVSLNSNHVANSSLIIRKFEYSHPVYTQNALIAKSKFDEICGVNNTYFCGAYWGNGFHEDGVVSALNVCNKFNLGIQIV